MEYLIGMGLALATCTIASLLKLQRERAFYLAVMGAIATYYVLFAVMSEARQALPSELLMACIFLVVAILGIRKSPWFMVLALGGHGVFDLVHHFLINNPGVPGWWPGFCLAFDGVMGGFLAVLLRQSRQHVLNRQPDKKM